MSVISMFEEFLSEFENRLDSLDQVSAVAIGLDSRAGRVWVDVENGEIISINPPSIDYYGGFEYIDAEYAVCIGDYKVYSSEDERVAKALEFYEENQNG